MTVQFADGAMLDAPVSMQMIVNAPIVPKRA